MAADERVTAVLASLRAAADERTRAAMAGRYGIRTDLAFGVPMRTMQAIAAPLRRDHDLAAGIWATGWYEARTLAALIDDPAQLTVVQMDRWAAEFDNWAIVDTTCFHLFDRAPDAWSRVSPWAGDDREMVRRAGFALLWALALHDREAPDAAFASALDLIEAQATDARPLVTKAMVMALRAVGHKRPAVTPLVIALAGRLAEGEDPAARRVGRPIRKAFEG